MSAWQELPITPGIMDVAAETVLIVRRTMDTDMDAGIMATTTCMGVSLVATKTAAGWIENPVRPCTYLSHFHNAT